MQTTIVRILIIIIIIILKLKLHKLKILIVTLLQSYNVTKSLQKTTNLDFYLYLCNVQT